MGTRCHARGGRPRPQTAPRRRGSAWSRRALRAPCRAARGRGGAAGRRARRARSRRRTAARRAAPGRESRGGRAFRVLAPAGRAANTQGEWESSPLRLHLFLVTRRNSCIFIFGLASVQWLPGRCAAVGPGPPRKFPSLVSAPGQGRSLVSTRIVPRGRAAHVPGPQRLGRHARSRAQSVI